MVMVEEQNPGKKGKGGGGGVKLERKVEPGEEAEDLALHPSCVTISTKEGLLSNTYLHERVKTTRVYIRDATPVSPYALISLVEVKCQWREEREG